MINIMEEKKENKQKCMHIHNVYFNGTSYIQHFAVAVQPNNSNNKNVIAKTQSMRN